MLERFAQPASPDAPPPPRRRDWRPPRLGLNLTAMIDVVFLLLVYFMSATQFKVDEEIYRLDLPQRGEAADPFDLPRTPLRIAIKSGLGGSIETYTIQVHGASEQPDDFDALYEYLRRNQRAGGIGGLFEPDHPIVIEPAQTARWEHAIATYNAAARARYTNVNFARPG